MKKLFASFLLIVGCAKFASYPEWYITPPNNSNIFLYGVGEGFDPEEARMAALSNVGSRLRTSVASSSASSTDVDNLGRSDSFASKIKANSAKITFTNYDIEKSQYVGKSNSYVALVKVDISKLVGEYRDQIRKKISAINAMINQKNAGVFKEKISLEKAYKLALEAEEMSGVIKSVDRSHYDQMQVLLGSLVSRIDVLSKNIYFSIDCNNDKISSMISEMVLASGFAVKSSGGIKISCDLTFKTQNSGVSSLIIENLSGKIAIIDSTGASVLLKNISKNGSSMMSSEMAKSAAVNALKTDIQKLGGLFEFLQ